MIALDLFAGTGWGVGCQWLGIEENGVEIMPEAIATREANGMNTIYEDVWEGIRGTTLGFDYELLIASPPCPTFSAAGAGAGRLVMPQILELIETGDYHRGDILHEFGEDHDLKTALVLTPLVHIQRDRPSYVVLEQVPPVLPIWEAAAAEMRKMGYSVVTGILTAEQYGVPQTRRRAILIGRLDGIEAVMPRPTHSQYYTRDPKRLDEGVLPWVSMADAMGWSEGYLGFPRRSDGLAEVEIGGVAYRARDLRSVDEPSQTVTEKSRSWKRWGYEERPAPTVTGGGGKASGIEIFDQQSRKKLVAEIDAGRAQGNGRVVNPKTPLDPIRLTVDEAAALQSYPKFAVKKMGAGMVERYGDRPGRSTSEPAFTLRASAGGMEPGGFVWKHDDGSTRRMVPEEAARLQSYPEFVWCGSKSKQFLQVGNAVPPVLAAAILSTLPVDAESTLETAA
jgi:DNA (cytosine-5)-methyltransferase 1